MWDLLTIFCFIATINFNHTVFELGCKILVDKINIVSGDLTKLRNIASKYKKI